MNRRRVRIDGDMFLGLLRSGHFECRMESGEPLPDDARIIGTEWTGQTLVLVLESESFAADMPDIDLLYRVKDRG